MDDRFTPGGHRSPTPLVVAVGRLVPVKRFDELLRALAKVKTDQPDLEAVLIGEGYERAALEALRAELGADDWVHLPGRVPDEELVSWYRRAWVVASTSQREGWGMTLTEAAACGTPAVATDIAGHHDAVVDGESGLLVDDLGQLLGRARPRAGRRRAAQPAQQGRADPGPLVHLGRHGAPRPRGAGRGSDELNARRPLRTPRPVSPSGNVRRVCDERTHFRAGARPRLRRFSEGLVLKIRG